MKNEALESPESDFLKGNKANGHPDMVRIGLPEGPMAKYGTVGTLIVNYFWGYSSS
jgi:hypothetical protein